MATGPFHLELVNGGRYDYWVTNLETVHQWITDFDLKPVATRALLGHVQSWQGAAGQSAIQFASASSEATSQQLPWPGPICGGLKTAHLHYGGQVYTLTEEQWEQVSRGVIADVTKALQNVRSYTDIMNLTQAGPVFRG